MITAKNLENSVMLTKIESNLCALLVVAALLVPTSNIFADILSEAKSIPDSRNTSTQNWEGPHVKEIMTDKDWDAILAESKKSPVFIFKHSTECPISAGAAFRTNDWIKNKSTKETPKFYFVKVIERRPVSKKIEKDIAVKHESPQLLLMKNGKNLWNTSHEKITAKSIETAIKTHATKPDSESVESE